MLAGMANLVPVTLVVGEEEFLVDRAVREALAQARAALAESAGGSEGGDLHDLEASALGHGELASLTSPSLFGGGATVIVRNAQHAAKEIAADLTKYAASPAPDAAVIITHAGGAKNKALVTDLAKAGARQVDCPKLTRPSERTDFVRAEFKRAGRQADSEAVRALLDSVGGDLRELASAVSQLASDTEGRIGAATVARYYRGRAEATGFSVADHAVEGRLNEALEQLRWALSTGTAPVLITSALATGVRLLGRVGAASRNANPNALAAEVGAPPWKIDRIRQQLRGWHPDGVARALQAVAEADAQVKGGGVSPEYALERAVRQIVAYRAATR
ncbi:DNA polymerase III subunit delta [Trebonia kvetii]|uniref:DNA-directed DNA polymerase n=2 Tax=Trebonia kvetii TaxID=2480626 RepID=A0A6P2BQT6_9ACTN|nr:DNA polymerase III subunit delta [Trebonia kvetii]